MGVLSFKSGKKIYFDSYNNQYYKGNNCFSYSDDSELKTSVHFIGDVHNIMQYSGLHKCNLHYSDGSIYNNIIVGLDLDRMKNDSDYTKFVFENLFSVNNVKNLEKSHYIGSVIAANSKLEFKYNDRIFKMYLTSDYLMDLALMSDLCESKSSKVKVKKR